MDKTSNCNNFSKQNKILLDFVNALLVQINKNQIDDLIQFIDINREDLVTQECNKIYQEHESKIFTVFSKQKCRWYKRKEIKNYVLTLLRTMCSEVGLSFTYEQKDVSVEINNKYYRKTGTFYSIKK